MAAAQTQIIPFDITAQKAAASKLVDGSQLASIQLAARTLQVIDEEGYQTCIEIRNRAASAEKKILDFWEPLAKAANGLHKLITGARADMAAPYVEVKQITTKKAEEFLLAQKRAKREAEDALARAAQTEQAKIQREGEELIAQGYVKQGQAKLAEANMVVQGVALPSAVPASDARVGDTFTGEVYDLMALIKAVASGETTLMWDVKGDSQPVLIVNPAVLKAVVDRSGMAAEKLLPGIMVKEGVRISARRLG
jgi:hypothetical protein